MSQAPPPRWLLIGNSRWHWAERSPEGSLRGWDGAPALRGEEGRPPLAWAAVGPLPDPAWAPVDRRVSVGDVPLAGCPPWLGVDRALAGWGAWREWEEAVLVADAGTVLSLTLVTAAGRFRGGRLLAGLGLQLEAMGNRTALLPRLQAAPHSRATPGEGGGEEERESDPAWPLATEAAMRVGVETALAGAVVAAARASDSRRLVITGGDGPLLRRRVAAPLAGLGFTVCHSPLLCLESLARLRPGD
ncbi:MAG: type III pantothenate kinase [Cyanobacteriota bacterium]|nr:type III pantothenate kinase [Cyanobacteriota bacterium]